MSESPMPAHLKKLVEAHEAKQALLAKKWAVGFHDRDHGHGDFAVITVDEELIAECPDKMLAEHIVEIHNNSLAS